MFIWRKKNHIFSYLNNTYKTCKCVWISSHIQSVTQHVTHTTQRWYWWGNCYWLLSTTTCIPQLAFFFFFFFLVSQVQREYWHWSISHWHYKEFKIYRINVWGRTSTIALINIFLNTYGWHIRTAGSNMIIN